MTPNTNSGLMIKTKEHMTKNDGIEKQKRGRKRLDKPPPIIDIEKNQEDGQCVLLQPI